MASAWHLLGERDVAGYLKSRTKKKKYSAFDLSILPTKREKPKRPKRKNESAPEGYRERRHALAEMPDNFVELVKHYRDQGCSKTYAVALAGGTQHTMTVWRSEHKELAEVLATFRKTKTGLTK